MPRYTWKLGGAEADKQYVALPDGTRRLVNQRIDELLENPTGNPNREYDPHTVPIGDDKGFIMAIQSQAITSGKLASGERLPATRGSHRAAPTAQQG